MTTIFVNKIKNNQGGNPVQINELKGIDTAGSVAVQGEGSNTTNLQQGLAKCWTNFNQISTMVVRDSFNASTHTDNGSGDHTVNFTNNMGNANYSSVAAGGRGTVESQYSRQGPGTKYASVSTSSWTAECGSNTYSPNDWEICCWAIFGDLA
jgi:hypothetical protein